MEEIVNSEKEHFRRFLGKYIFVVKRVKDRDLVFKGIVTDILDDKLIIDDFQNGKVPLSYENLSVTGIKKNGDTRK